MKLKHHPDRPELPRRTAGQLTVRSLTTPASPARRDAASPERRNLASRAQLLRRIEAEFREMPGLRITFPQAQRLFGLRSDVCVRVLATLVELAVLRRDPDGQYCLDGHRP